MKTVERLGFSAHLSRCVGYYTCLAFRELAPNTQAKRRAILERFRNEHGDKRIALLPQHVLERMLNQIKKPATARHWLTAVRGLLEFAAKEKFCASNPALGIKLPKWRGGHHRAWTDAEVEQYERTHAIGTKARLAFALGLYTVQRVSDVIRMGRQHIRNDELTVEQKRLEYVWRCQFFPSSRPCSMLRRPTT